MGLIASRRSAGAEEPEVSTGNPYRYPPRSGKYFSNYFIMGGERFETNHQDIYLFGENDDLNFLGSKPVPFPYPAPQGNEPTKTLKSLVNIRRDSVRFVREAENQLNVKDSRETMEPSSTRYNIEFTFDSDVKCAVTIYYFATEEIVNKQAVYHPRDAQMNSETFHYKRGANQVFSQSLHVIDPTKFPEEDWQYNIDKEVIPVVIQCAVEEDEHLGHSHVTYAVVDKLCDGTFGLRCLKQRQFVDGIAYLLQEIYGIENKNTERAKRDNDDIDDNGSECVICMSESRDTLILPCRHLCLCNCCADNLRYQANNCPICRAKFYALLQVRAMRHKASISNPVGGPCAPTTSVATRPMCESSESATMTDVNQDGVPAGFEAVSLIEALNGPTSPQCASVVNADGTLRSLQLTDTSAHDDECVTTPASDVDKRSSYIQVAEMAGAEGGASDTDPCFHPDGQNTTLPPDHDQPSVHIVNEKSPSVGLSTESKDVSQTTSSASEARDTRRTAFSDPLTLADSDNGEVTPRDIVTADTGSLPCHDISAADTVSLPQPAAATASRQHLNVDNTDCV